MFKNKRALLVVLGLLILVALLVACAAEEKATPTPAAKTPTVAAEAEPKHGGTLWIALSADPAMHDPQRDVGQYTFWQRVGNELINFRYGPGVDYYDLTPAPDLAESWDISPDGLTYTFHLRKGVKWQDKPPVNGRELVAADVKFTFDRLFRVAKSLYGYQLGDVKSIEAPDKYTVRFTLGEPYAPFLTHLGNFWGVILPPECEEKIEGGFAKPEAIIGTGPFMLESYTVNVVVVYKRNPTYFRSPLPYLDEIRETIIADSSTREAALRSGKLDIAGVAKLNLPSVQKTNPELQLMPMRSGSLSGWAIAMRSDKPPFNDVRVRQAVALAIDRQVWVDALYLGDGVIDNGPLPAGMTAWKLPTDQLGEGAKYYKYDPVESRRLLAEAGYPNGFEITYTTHSTGYAEAADLIADFLGKVGIKVTIKVMEYSGWLAKVAAGYGTTYEGMSISTQWTVLDPDLTLWGFYYPGQSTNISCVNDPKLTAMLEAQRREMGFEARKKVIDEIQRYLAVQNYRIPAPAGFGQTLVQPYVRDYYPKVWYDLGRVRELIWLDK